MHSLVCFIIELPSYQLLLTLWRPMVPWWVQL